MLHASIVFSPTPCFVFMSGKKDHDFFIYNLPDVSPGKAAGPSWRFEIHGDFAPRCLFPLDFFFARGKMKLPGRPFVLLTSRMIDI